MLCYKSECVLYVVTSSFYLFPVAVWECVWTLEQTCVNHWAITALFVYISVSVWSFKHNWAVGANDGIMRVLTQSCVLFLWMHTLTFVKSQGKTILTHSFSHSVVIWVVDLLWLSQFPCFCWLWNVFDVGKLNDSAHVCKYFVYVPSAKWTLIFTVFMICPQIVRLPSF